jgi:hypothetical protein
MFGDLNLGLPLYHSLMNPSKFQHFPGFEVAGTYNLNKWLGIDVSYQHNSGKQIIDQTLQLFDYTNTGRFITTVSSTPTNVNQGFPITPNSSEFQNSANSKTKASGFGTGEVARNTFLVGPRLSYRKYDRITPFAHIQFGLSRFERKNFKMKYAFSSEYNEYDAAGTYLAARQTYDIAGTFEGNTKSTGFAMSFGGGLDLKINKRISLRLIQADYLATRNRFTYKYKDNFSSDISDYTYKIVSVFQNYSDSGPVYADYNQETRQRVIYSGERNLQYSTPSQFMNNIKLTAGIVIRF